MAINFNFKIQKKDLWLLAAIFVFLVGVGYVIAYGGNNPTVHGHSAGEIEVVGFGDWVDVTAVASGGAVQGPATTDGFVLAIGTATSVNIAGYTDANNPPTTMRVVTSISPAAGEIHSFTMPVKKGHYWEVINVNTIGYKIYWIPLGG